MRKSNLTYEQLIELAPKDRPFQIEVQVEAGNKVFWFCIFQHKKLLGIECGRGDGFWIDHYDGTFTLIDEYRNMYEKPEVLEVGTEVEILDSARECGDYIKADDKDIGTVKKIISVKDNFYGVSYVVDGNAFPHYCVRPVEKVEEEEEEIITVNGKKYKLIEE